MEIANELNTLDEEIMQQVFDHYGVENINYAQAKKIANSQIKDRKKILSDRMKTLDGEIEKMQKKREYKAAPKGFVLMQDPDTGEEWEIDVKKVNEAKEAKWKVIKKPS